MYRVWDKEKYCWAKDVFLSPNGDIVSVKPHKWKSDTYKTDLKPDNKFIVQYSTNITDKHNKEIYEGDIIKTNFGVTGVILYVPDRLGFLLMDYENSKYYILTELRCKQCKIIGNIMENSELIPYYVGVNNGK